MTTIGDLFQFAGVPYAGAVHWGTEVPLDAPGVYVIATSGDIRETSGIGSCPVDLAAVRSLLAARPGATIDGQPADVEGVVARLSRMWLRNEPAIYVGLAGSSVQHRVRQFYRTRIGARAPHAGGWPIKMLDTAGLWVHYGPTPSPASAEAAMVAHFVASLPKDVRESLVDPTAPLPFANLTFPGGRRKNHGFGGVKEPKGPRAAPADDGRLNSPPQVAPSSALDGQVQPVVVGRSRRTQNVTDADLAAGQLRIPRLSKDIFPAARSQITIILGNQTHRATWDPRVSGTTERSGTIRVSRSVLTACISSGGPRTIEVTAAGYSIH